MKKIFLIISSLLYLASTIAQINFYKGEWTKIKSEANFTGLLKLDLKDTALTGEIVWTFKAIDSADDALMDYYKGQKGKMGIEYVSGFLSNKTNDILLEGTHKADPDLIISTDKYILKLSLDKSMIYGRTFSNGENNGLTFFLKIDKIAGKKEFDLLKAKILLKMGDKAIR